MKILHVASRDIQGGAAKASFRMHNGLKEENIESLLLVQSKLLYQDEIITIGSPIEKLKTKLRVKLDPVPVKKYKKRTQTLFSPAWVFSNKYIRLLNELNADIVHLHWINDGMIRIEDLKKIKAPIVWTLNDMWPLTGGCHYDEYCGLYKHACGTCRVLGSTTENDLSRKVFKRKLKTYKSIKNLTVVGVSKWLADCARESTLLKDRKILHIPNPVNTKDFSPFDQSKARELFNLPLDKKLILFGAIYATSDPRKGFQELKKALTYLKGNNHELVVFGGGEPDLTEVANTKIHYLGYIHDEITLRALYSAVDVMIVPSLQEAFGLSISESMACGTPVISFDATGPKFLIDHKINGYLARAFDPSDLADGINWVVEQNEAKYKIISNNAREKATLTYDSRVVAKQYISLYKEILGQLAV